MKDKFWKTGISKVEPNKILIRGYNLSHLIGKYSFGDIVYLLFSGELPSENEGRMIEAILVAGCDHSLAAPSANSVRFVSSSGVPLQASVAAGIISLSWDILSGKDAHSQLLFFCSFCTLQQYSWLESGYWFSFFS